MEAVDACFHELEDLVDGVFDACLMRRGVGFVAIFAYNGEAGGIRQPLLSVMRMMASFESTGVLPRSPGWSRRPF